MDVTTNGDRRIHALYIAFLHKYLSGLGAEVLDFLLADDFSSAELLDLLVDLAHF